MAIHVDSEGITQLKNALQSHGEEYKQNLAKLNNLISEITSGDIQGDLANDLLEKYQAKETELKNLANTIDEAEQYMGVQGSKFSDLIGNVSSEMK